MFFFQFKSYIDTATQDASCWFATEHNPHLKIGLDRITIDQSPDPNFF